LEVEQQRDRLAHADIGEHRTPGIEYVIAACLRHSGGQRLLDYAALAHGGKIVRGLPASRIVLVAHVVETALERLQMRIGLAVVVETNLVEVPQAAADGKIAAPIIGIAFESDALAGIDLADDVGATSKRRLERRLLEQRGFERMVCQNRHQSKDERKLAV